MIQMTDSQVDLLIAYSGMLEEGLKYEEAIACLLFVGSAEDIAWLIRYIKHPEMLEEGGRYYAGDRVL